MRTCLAQPAGNTLNALFNKSIFTPRRVGRTTVPSGRPRFFLGDLQQPGQIVDRRHRLDRRQPFEFGGITWERPDAKEVHIKGIFDNKHRLMVVICPPFYSAACSVLRLDSGATRLIFRVGVLLG
mgnify:CR=1 FL=1